MKQSLLILSCLVCLCLLLGCSDTRDQQRQGRDKNATPHFSVSDANHAVWPSAAGEPIEAFDERLTRKNFLAVLDMSGSMRENDCSGNYPTKADAAREALIAWLESVPRQANAGLVVFSTGRVRLRVPLGVDNRRKFKKAVMATAPSGGTPLRSALALAHQELENRARYQNGYGDYRMVVITDGQHSEGENPRSVVDEILNNPANPVQIYTIGFCISDSALNQPDRIIYQSANNPEELRKGLDRVLAESTDFNTELIKEFQNDEQ